MKGVAAKYVLVCCINHTIIQLHDKYCEEYSRSEIQYNLYCWHFWTALLYSTTYAEDSQVGRQKRGAVHAMQSSRVSLHPSTHAQFVSMNLVCSKSQEVFIALITHYSWNVALRELPASVYC